jgi:NitT/TauT family transport system ATP-binding protein
MPEDLKTRTPEYPLRALREVAPAQNGAARNGHGSHAAAVTAKLRLQGINMSFASRQGRVEALKDVDLTIYPGEFVCLVGPSGCGKSTLLNIIAGLIRPDSGEALKDGKPITGAGPDRAVIFQDAALFPWLTAVQNVEFALKHIRDKRERRQRAMDHLQTVHLGRFASSHPHELSGGMRQRVAIARALALDPDVLLMDEPFAALDAQTRDLLIDEVQRIWLAMRKTVVFVTHNVLEAVTLADRVICMGARPGCIKEELPVNLARPREVESPDTARIARTILNSLQDEIAKIAQEESDYAEADRARNGDVNTGRILHPTSGTMGDGI